MNELSTRQAWLARAVFAAALLLSASAILAGFAALGGSASAASGQYEYGKNVLICHQTGSAKNPTQTIRVSENAVPAHLAHGDTLGPCPTGR